MFDKHINRSAFIGALVVVALAIVISVIQNNLPIAGQTFVDPSGEFRLELPRTWVPTPFQIAERDQVSFISRKNIQSLSELQGRDIWLTINTLSFNENLTVNQLADRTVNNLTGYEGATPNVINNRASLTIFGFPAIRQFEQANPRLDSVNAFYDVLYVQRAGKFFVLLFQANGEEGLRNNRKIIDSIISSFQFLTDVNGSGGSAALSTRTLESSILQDMGASELSASEKQALDAQIENWALYTTSPSVVLGGLDCGASIRHDQLVALNNADKRSLNLNNGLLITTTPNLYNWNEAELLEFGTDETVVCGVATTSPLTTAGNRILWWTTCVGGAGPPPKGSPDYERTVNCVQAEEVVKLHFGIDY